MVQDNVSTKYICKHCSIVKMETVILFFQYKFSEAFNVHHIFWDCVFILVL